MYNSLKNWKAIKLTASGKFSVEDNFFNFFYEYQEMVDGWMMSIFSKPVRTMFQSPEATVACQSRDIFPKKKISRKTLKVTCRKKGFRGFFFFFVHSKEFNVNKL